MNLLAHAYLSGDNEYLLIGNFIADHIKGNKIGHFPPEVVRGIMLHRAIDQYTDHHPVFNRSCNRLYYRFHKYAGIVTDIYYDHFLANQWQHYHKEKLEQFTGRCYATLLRHYHILPQRTRSLLPHIMMDNWLMSYADIGGLTRSFQGISRRVRYNPGLEYAAEELQQHYSAFEKDFREFFPDLVFFTNKKITEMDATPVPLSGRVKRQKRRQRWLKILKRDSPGRPSTEAE